MCEPLVGSDGKTGQAHVTTRKDMVLYGCLKLLGSPGNLVEGTGDPPSLCTEVTDVDKAGYSYDQAGGTRQRGRQKSSWCQLQTSQVVNPGQHTQRLSLEIPPGCLDTCAPTDLSEGLLWDCGPWKSLPS